VTRPVSEVTTGHGARRVELKKKGGMKTRLRGTCATWGAGGLGVFCVPNVEGGGGCAEARNILDSCHGLAVKEGRPGMGFRAKTAREARNGERGLGRPRTRQREKQSTGLGNVKGKRDKV